MCAMPSDLICLRERYFRENHSAVVYSRAMAFPCARAVFFDFRLLRNLCWSSLTSGLIREQQKSKTSGDYFETFFRRHRALWGLLLAVVI